MIQPTNAREREIWNGAVDHAERQMLIDLFEASDKKGVIRTLWAKALNMAEQKDKPFTEERLRAYADGVLHCYNIMKRNDSALEIHAENGKTWDGKENPKVVHFPLTAEDVKLLGSRQGH
jgi:hypothetical protein